MRRTRRPAPKLPHAKQPLQRGAYKALTAALRARAEELDLSVRVLARRLKKPQTTVHKTLRGQRRLDPIEFIDWCEALEIRDPVAFIESVRRY